MNRIKTVVIDDEHSNRAFIKQLITVLNPSFEVVGEADGVKSGFDLITNLQPEVIFLDIRMADGNGFNLLDLFSEITFEVVFISAFDSYALKAFEFNALDYVLKPIDTEKFTRTLIKVQQTIEKQLIQTGDLKKIIEAYDVNELVITKIPVHNGTKVHMLNIADIVYVKSDDGSTIFKMITGEKFLSAKQFSDFEFIIENFPPMIRINKGTYININFISNYSKGIICIVTMKDATEFEISRRKKGEILEIIESNKKLKNS